MAGAWRMLPVWAVRAACGRVRQARCEPVGRRRIRSRNVRSRSQPRSCGFRRWPAGLHRLQCRPPPALRATLAGRVEPTVDDGLQHHRADLDPFAAVSAASMTWREHPAAGPVRLAQKGQPGSWARIFCPFAESPQLGEDQVQALTQDELHGAEAAHLGPGPPRTQARCSCGAVAGRGRGPRGGTAPGSSGRSTPAAASTL